MKPYFTPGGWQEANISERRLSPVRSEMEKEGVDAAVEAHVAVWILQLL